LGNDAAQENPALNEDRREMQLASLGRSTRRFFLKSALGTLAGGMGLLGWTLLVEPRWLTATHHDLVLPDLPETWQGRRLVHVSDLHVGRVTLGYLKHSMRKINLLQPDLLVITGDLVDRSGGIGQQLDSVLAALQPARIASLACLGNHDFGARWSQIPVADSVAAAAADHGIHVLRNEEVEIDGLRFFGLEDYWTPRFAAGAIRQLANVSQTSVCLCHNPDVCDIGDWGLFQGIILSGHTHGGQCKPPFLPPPLLPVRNRRYTSGFFDLGPGRRVFITRGIGHTLRARFNCRPEITVFRLLRSG
jgi:uncharacterized protein